MKVSKNAQILFTLMFITSLVSTGFPWTISGHNVFLQPPEDGDWIISTNETLEGDTYIMNGSIEIEPGAKLTIQNCDLTFNSTLLERHEIQVDGALEILNSNISVVDGNYTLTIDANSQHVNSINIEGSKISFTSFKLRYSNITIDQTEIYYSPEIDSVSSVFISVTNSEFIDLGDGWDIYNVTTGIFENNDFVNMNFAIDVEKSDNVTIKSNYISEIAEYAIRMKTVTLPIIQDNTIENAVLGMTITSASSYIYKNTITNASIAIDLFSVTKASIEDNIFNDIRDMAIQGVSSSSTTVFDNEFNDLNIGMFLSETPFETYSNAFNNVTTGISVFDTDTIEIYENTFNQVSDIAIIIDESQRTEVYDNNITDALRGIAIEQGRYNVVLGNYLIGVDEGIAIIGGRQIEVLGNSIEDTVSGIYMEQSKYSIITANTAINATFGISIWSSPEAKIASNGVFESIYGISVWFSELVTLSGNILQTSDIGIVGRNSYNLIIKDSDLTVLDYGLQVIQCINVRISGNTFAQIATDAIVVKESINFNVYDNNFLNDINNLAHIEEGLGDFDIIGDIGTIVGNYYEDFSGEVVFITVATYDGKSYDIYDNGTRTDPYQPAPTIEFVTQDVVKPTDK
ncbi:MAG: right-handed parallel beta-helix repeat-containing protein, partial [Candidatus Heimdallarchaeota archaeon]|nr:right-handed parallel beta-helix repeat-containing protein [Candidatus Heimdallarchaeota archaeon]